MAAGMDFSSHKSLLMILFGFLGLFSFTVEAATKKYQFDVSYIYSVCIYGHNQHANH